MCASQTTIWSVNSPAATGPRSSLPDDQRPAAVELGSWWDRRLRRSTRSDQAYPSSDGRGPEATASARSWTTGRRRPVRARAPRPRHMNGGTAAGHSRRAALPGVPWRPPSGRLHVPPRKRKLWISLIRARVAAL
jgi:hypothetical protein